MAENSEKQSGTSGNVVWSSYVTSIDPFVATIPYTFSSDESGSLVQNDNIVSSLPVCTTSSNAMTMSDVSQNAKTEQKADLIKNRQQHNIISA